MKLLKFVNGDAPQSIVGATLHAGSLTISTTGNQGKGGRTANGGKSSAAMEGSASCAKAWKVQELMYTSSSPSSGDAVPVHGSPMHGSYWLLDDNGKPVCVLNSVLLATPDVRRSAGVALPRGIGEEDVAGLDLRSKLGQKLERTRHEYGTTYKTASKSARLMMNAEEVQEKKHERMKRERTALAETLESGTGLDNKRPAKQAKK